jgi:electron transfer flavoprotein beta subunit
MHIVACVKFTPDPGDLQVRPDGSISLERAEWVIGGFDLQAVEAGVRMVEQQGGKLRKDLLSHGPDALALIIDEGLRGADTATTARVLARAVEKLGDVELVLCGEGSADLYFQQVGLQLGERLGWPTFNAVSKISLSGESSLLIERDLEEEIEVLEVPLPAVLMVTTDINEARLPTMKEILKASKKPVSEWSLADLGVPPGADTVEVVQVSAPHQVQRKGVMLTGSPQEAAQELVRRLTKEGIL